MSQMANHMSSLESMLKKYTGTPLPVLETFYEMVTNQEWDSEDVIYMLENSKGDSEYVNNIINKFIEREKSYV